MTLKELNQLNDKEFTEAMGRCCGSSRWQNAMLKQRPFKSIDALQSHSDVAWSLCNSEDGLEAFKHHPKIGDKDGLKKGFSSTRKWAGNEQQGVTNVDDSVTKRLSKGNEEYYDKFGFIFIVFATGKSAVEMMSILEERLENNRDEEIRIAMKEQHKITKLRLNKLVAMSQITTHVLDTSKGQPASGIPISLSRRNKTDDSWEPLAEGITNSDGRVSALLNEEEILLPGIYRLLFQTELYFKNQKIKSFYPFVTVVFEVLDTQHYHVPLLLNPFGYSTYRGS